VPGFSALHRSPPLGSPERDVIAIVVDQRDVLHRDAEVLVREVASTDRRALSFMFTRLSGESRYRRFLHPKNELSDRELDELTRLDHWHHEALIAWSPRPRAPIGVARYVRSEEFDSAEVAITIVDAWQRRGLGRALMLALRDRAELAGIRRFTSSILWSNRAGLRLAHQLGSCRRIRSAGGIVELECFFE
jgi:RimJ/RimL family protein N-acetyltransferase